MTTCQIEFCQAQGELRLAGLSLDICLLRLTSRVEICQLTKQIYWIYFGNFGLVWEIYYGRFGLVGLVCKSNFGPKNLVNCGQ